MLDVGAGGASLDIFSLFCRFLFFLPFSGRRFLFFLSLSGISPDID